MKTTRPLEVVYLSTLGINTKEDGELFMFFALDDYSQMLFLLGIEENTGEYDWVQKCIAFTQHDDFTKVFKNKPFSLILPIELGIPAQEALTEVFTLFNGTVKHNQKLVFEKVAPVKEFLNESFSNRGF